MRSLASLLACLLAAGAASGCASWFMKGEPPEVLVTDVTPLDSTAFEQRLKVDLRIRNPNDADLEVTGMDFRLELNGKRLARGLSNKPFTVPRLGEAVSSVETSTSTFDLLRQALGLRNAGEITYAIAGVLYLKNGTLSFDHSGVLVDKGDLSGIATP